MGRKQIKVPVKSDNIFSWRRLDVLPAIYTVIILFGGLFAFYRTGSVPSLSASLVCFVFLTLGTYKTTINKRDHYFTSSVIFCIFLVMGYRYLMTHKAVPCFVATLSLSLLIYLIGRAKDLVYDREVDE